MLRLLLISVMLSCKPAVRQPVADLHAITDGKISLGTVAALDQDRQVYRLLVCKNTIDTDNSSVFDDDNSCRNALVDQQGTEVVLFPNQLQRGFAEKYKGRIKGAVVGTAIAVPFLIAVPIIQQAVKPAFRYIKKITKQGNFESVGKLVDGEPGLAAKANDFYSQLYAKQAEGLDKLAKKSVAEDDIANIIELNHNTYKLVKETSFVSKLEDGQQMLLELKKTGKNSGRDALSNVESNFLDEVQSNLFGHDNAFLELYSRHTKDLDADEVAEIFSRADPEEKQFFNKMFPNKENGIERQQIQKALMHIANAEERSFLLELLDRTTGTKVDVADLFSRSITTERQLIEDLPRYHELFVKEIIAEAKTIDEAIAIVSKELGKTKASVDKTTAELNELAKNFRAGNNAEIFGRWGEGWLGFGIGLTVAGSVFHLLDKSIWGYNDRQASNYWNKIFHDDYRISDAYTVKDLPAIVRSLAKTFGYRVNDRAFQMAGL